MILIWPNFRQPNKRKTGCHNRLCYCIEGATKFVWADKNCSENKELQLQLLEGERGIGGLCNRLYVAV